MTKKIIYYLDNSMDAKMLIHILEYQEDNEPIIQQLAVGDDLQISLRYSPDANYSNEDYSIYNISKCLKKKK